MLIRCAYSFGRSREIDTSPSDGSWRTQDDKKCMEDQVKLQGVRRDFAGLRFGAHSSPFSSPFYASIQAGVRKRSVLHHSQVPRFVPPRHCVPSQRPRFRWQTDDVGAGGECDRTPSLNQSPRKILPRTTLQTSSTCGIYSRLVPRHRQ